MPDAHCFDPPDLAGNPVKFCCLSLFACRRRWGMTWRGWLLVMLATAAGSAVFVLRLHPFLAVTQRVETPVLAVEGWISGSALKAVADEFRQGGYQIIYVIAGPVAADSSLTPSPSLTKRKLESFGIPESAMQFVPGGSPRKDRTYSNAVALRNWLKGHQKNRTGLNVMTLSVHARRSRLMYQEAFGTDTAVGIIAAVDPEYDPEQWWNFSRGVKEVISEGAAYLYAKLLFRAGG